MADRTNINHAPLSMDQSGHYGTAGDEEFHQGDYATTSLPLQHLECDADDQAHMPGSCQRCDTPVPSRAQFPGASAGARAMVETDSDGRGQRARAATIAARTHSTPPQGERRRLPREPTLARIGHQPF